MNQVALVTGGTRGIGFGVARQLAEAGFDLVICGMRPADQVTDVVETLKGFGGEVLYCVCDVGDADARASMLDAVREHFGRLHVLVNNAGVAPKQRLDVLEATEESFEWVLRTNLQGPYFLTQAVANWMVEQKGDDPDFAGCIINVSSISATVASPNRGEYCVSKAGVSMATPVRVSCGSSESSSNLAMPKSSSFTVPSGVTRMFEGLRSRWTTRFWWAWCTARHTAWNSSRRWPMESLFSSQ